MKKFFFDQLSLWSQARDNYRMLKDADIKSLCVGGLMVKVQLNPARAISTNAKLDPESISHRACFLCRSNRPDVQKHRSFNGSKGKEYDIVVNPFPIMPVHYIVASVEHTPQSIWHRFADVMRLCRDYPEYTFIYNGPMCGASAPDHFHFQAFPTGDLPLLEDMKAGNALERITNIMDAELFRYCRFANGVFYISGETRKSVTKMFYRLLDCMPLVDGDKEPRINMFAFRNQGRYCCAVVFRKCHRSSHYFSENPRHHLAMSPGCVDMGGMFVTVDRKDFEKLDSALLSEVVSEITISAEEERQLISRLTRTQQKVTVKVALENSVEFEILSDGAGFRTAALKDGRIEYGGILYDELFFDEQTLSSMMAEPSFRLKMDGLPDSRTFAEFPGALKIVVNGSQLEVLNIVGVEDLVFSFLDMEETTGADMQTLERHAVELRTSIMDGSFPKKVKPYWGRLRPEAGISFNGNSVRAIDSTWGVTDLSFVGCETNLFRRS